jgi:hypothetical protein
MPEMATEAVLVADLHPPPRNARAHPEQQVIELARAVEKFGQTRPVVIDEANMVLAGNGLVMAFQRLGRREIIAHRMPGLSEADKTKLMLSDNRIFSLGIDDNVAILDLVRDLGDFDIPGFDADILKSLTIDTGALTEAALSGYGTLPGETVEEARGRQIPAGSTAAANDGANEPALAEGEILCPACGHVFVHNVE